MSRQSFVGLHAEPLTSPEMMSGGPSAGTTPKSLISTPVVVLGSFSATLVPCAPAGGGNNGLRAAAMVTVPESWAPGTVNFGGEHAPAEIARAASTNGMDAAMPRFIVKLALRKRVRTDKCP